MSAKTLVVNFYSGPGTGKSTFCAGTFAALKWSEVDCEQVTEYAKDVTWEESFSKLKNQLYVFSKQQSRLFRLNGKVDVVVTDAPLLHSIIYDAQGDELFQKLILREYDRYDNLNIFLKRMKKYNPNGRTQTLEQAVEIDKKTEKMLIENSISYETVDAVPENISAIVDIVKKRLKGK